MPRRCSAECRSHIRWIRFCQPAQSRSSKESIEVMALMARVTYAKLTDIDSLLRIILLVSRMNPKAPYVHTSCLLVLPCYLFAMIQVLLCNTQLRGLCRLMDDSLCPQKEPLLLAKFRPPGDKHPCFKVYGCLSKKTFVAVVEKGDSESLSSTLAVEVLIILNLYTIFMLTQVTQLINVLILFSIPYSSCYSNLIHQQLLHIIKMYDNDVLAPDIIQMTFRIFFKIRNVYMDYVLLYC